MNFRTVITVWFKEMRDTVRDRRTLMSMVVLPLFLMPALIVGLGKFSEYQVNKLETRTVTVAFENAVAAPDLVSFLKTQDKISVIEVSGALADAVKADRVDAGIVVPDGYEQTLADRTPITLTLFTHSTNQNASVVPSRLDAAISAYNQTVLTQRFAVKKIDTSILVGVSLKTSDVATDQEKSGFGLGFILPLFIVMWAITGGQYTAIDASAGEKERKTIESLLLTPVKRITIVLGKFLAVASTAMISVVVSISSMYFTMKYSGSNIFTSGTIASGSSNSGVMAFSMSIGTIAVLIGVGLLLVLLFSAIMLSISIFAKSFKEAQSYISPAYLVIILPIVIFNTLPGLKTTLWMFTLPAINAILLFKEVLVGTFSTSHILVTVATLIVCSAVAIVVTTKMYERENVVLKS